MFDEEEEALARINEILLDENLKSSEHYESIKQFADQFYKILRQTKKLVRISDNQQKIINENNEKLTQLTEDLSREQVLSQKLLLNILPAKVAEELKMMGQARPVLFKSATVLFTDFKGFTKSSELLSPNELISELDQYFTFFDDAISLFRLEKLKTIGDSYMCAGGIPIQTKTHAVDCTLAALHFQKFMKTQSESKKGTGRDAWEIRLGIHTGPVIAGVVGKKKFAYDIWGDTVNIASRMESSGEPGRVNISKDTYESIKDFFDCTSRGQIEAKNKGSIDMFFVDKVKEDLLDENGKINDKFEFLYNQIKETEATETKPFVERRKNLPDNRDQPTERRNNLFKYLSI